MELAVDGTREIGGVAEYGGDSAEEATDRIISHAAGTPSYFRIYRPEWSSLRRRRGNNGIA